MVTLQKSEKCKTTLTKWKSLSKRVKIIPKLVKITQKESVPLFRELTAGQLFLFQAVPRWASPQKVEWFSLG